MLHGWLSPLLCLVSQKDILSTLALNDITNERLLWQLVVSTNLHTGLKTAQCDDLSSVSTTRVDGWPVSITRQHGPCWRPVNSGNRALGVALRCHLRYHLIYIKTWSAKQGYNAPDFCSLRGKGVQHNIYLAQALDLRFYFVHDFIWLMYPDHHKWGYKQKNSACSARNIILCPTLKMVASPMYTRCWILTDLRLILQFRQTADKYGFGIGFGLTWRELRHCCWG